MIKKNWDMYEKYDALILDMDGTLIDSGKLHEQAWIAALNEYGIPIDRPLMRSLAGVPTKETVERLLTHFNIDINASACAVQALKERQVEEKLFEFIKPTALAGLVKYYHGKKPMAVGTGADSESAERLLEACGLTNFIDCVVGADQVAAHKPAPDTFLKCATQLRVEPARCVVFEDSPLGIEAALSAGMSPVNVEEDLGIINDYFL